MICSTCRKHFLHYWLITGTVTRLTLLVEQELITLPKFTPVFSGVHVTRSLGLCFVDRYLSFFPSSFYRIYGFWLPLWYLQTLLQWDDDGVCFVQSHHATLSNSRNGVILTFPRMLNGQLACLRKRVCRVLTVWFSTRKSRWIYEICGSLAWKLVDLESPKSIQIFILYIVLQFQMYR